MKRNKTGTGAENVACPCWVDSIKTGKADWFSLLGSALFLGPREKSISQKQFCGPRARNTYYESTNTGASLRKETGVNEMKLPRLHDRTKFSVTSMRGSLMAKGNGIDRFRIRTRFLSWRINPSVMDTRFLSEPIRSKCKYIYIYLSRISNFDKSDYFRFISQYRVCKV